MIPLKMSFVMTGSGVRVPLAAPMSSFWPRPIKGDWRRKSGSRHSDRDLDENQHSSPVRIVAFNPSEGWVGDVSEEIVKELVCSFEGGTPDWMIAEHVR